MARSFVLRCRTIGRHAATRPQPAWWWAVPALVAAAACARPSAPPVTMAPVPFLLDDIGGLALFPDEQEEARQLVARTLRDRGFAVVDADGRPPAVLLAMRGADPRDGRTCGRPLGLEAAIDRWGDSLGATRRLWLAVSREEGGVLLGSLHERGHSDPIGEARSTYDRALPWRVALVRSVETLPLEAAEPGPAWLPEEPAPMGPIPADLSRPPGPPRVAGERRHQARGLNASGVDALPALDEAFQLGPTTAAVEACIEHQDARLVHLLASVDDAGRLTRCVPELGDLEAGTCACAAIVGGATGTPGGRLDVELWMYAGDLVLPDGRVGAARLSPRLAEVDGRSTLVSDDPLVGVWPGGEANEFVSACFAARSDPEGATSVVRLQFDAAGQLQGSEWHAATRWSTTERLCVEQALQQWRPVCPSLPLATVDAVLDVFVRRAQ